MCSFDAAAGRIDVIPAAAGIGTFDDNRADAVEIDLDGYDRVGHRRPDPRRQPEQVVPSERQPHHRRARFRSTPAGPGEGA
ncbi:MAG TPA: hypothetical protein VK923_08145 [Euzebyales bacterium]|nr:hypothetical protein [Euzebyales bacterium]